jgi:type I restriction enzyme S subunit
MASMMHQKKTLLSFLMTSLEHLSGWIFLSKSSLYWEQAERYVSKGGQQQFNTNAVSRVKVPVPPLDVQDKIIYVLDNFDAICSDFSIGLPAEIEARQKQYKYYRDALLTYAATGKTILTTDELMA